MGGFVNDIYVNIVSAAVNSSLPYKTGAITSYVDYDDGYHEFGSGLNWYTLDFTNPFGHTRRFTGVTGGYHNGTNYVTKLGATTTLGLAFPDDLVIDWSTYNPITGEFLMWYRNANGVSYQWAAGITQVKTLTYGGYSWDMANIRQIFSLILFEGATSNQAFNYQPFLISTTASIWSSTTSPNNTTQAQWINNADRVMSYSSKLEGRQFLIVRIGNISELTL